MKIKILENFKDGVESYVKDDVRTVSDESGAYFCGNGWAEDVDGKVETAARSTTEVRLDVRNATHKQTADKV